MKFFLNVFLFAVQFVFTFCDKPFDYCSLNDNVCEGTTHIACGTLETKFDIQDSTFSLDQVNITVVQLSSNEKNALLNFGNTERNKIALGQTRLPTGSNLPKTVWDDELELFAKALAEIQSVGNGHKFCFKRRNGLIVYGNLLAQQTSQTIEESIQQMLNDSNNYVENVSSIKSLKEGAFISKMGCYFGHAALRNDTNLYEGGLSCVLDYGVERSAAADLFLEGVPCSACKNGVGCDSNYTGLCA